MGCQLGIAAEDARSSVQKAIRTYPIVHSVPVMTNMHLSVAVDAGPVGVKGSLGIEQRGVGAAYDGLSETVETV